jgi:nucleoside-diphosphate-sugar epimerase
MRIFVTGGTGFIGSHFLNAATTGGHALKALRRSAASRSRIPLARAPVWLDKELAEVTVEDLRGCDVLVHLAAEGITPQPASWDTCYRVNVMETLALVQRGVQAGVRRVVVTGTYAEYGLAGLRFDPIPPDAPLEPTDPYAASKASAAVALCALSRVLKFELAYLRVFSAYGEGQYETNFWPALRRAALAGEDFAMTAGDQVRDFTPVMDIAKMLVAACARPEVRPGAPWLRNAASGRPVRLRDFAEQCWQDFGAKGRLLVGAVPMRAGEVTRYVPQV